MLKPKCLSGEQCYGYNIEGFLLPCCWCDQPERIKEFATLTQEKFKITNADSIESIIKSDEWQEFFQILIDKPEKAPECCKTYCSDTYEHKRVSYT